MVGEAADIFPIRQPIRKIVSLQSPMTAVKLSRWKFAQVENLWQTHDV
jgi:hypothetical protein